MYGGKGPITPVKRKEAVGREEGGILLFSEWYSPVF